MTVVDRVQQVLGQLPAIHSELDGGPEDLHPGKRRHHDQNPDRIQGSLRTDTDRSKGADEHLLRLREDHRYQQEPVDLDAGVGVRAGIQPVQEELHRLRVVPGYPPRCKRWFTQVIVLEKDKATFEKTGTTDSIRVALSMKCSEGTSRFTKTTEIISGFPKTSDRCSSTLWQSPK